MRHRRLSIVATGLLSLQWAASACGTSIPLYERLGGEGTVRAIASDLVDRAASDPRTERTWRKVGLPRVKASLSQYLCFVAGGPCTYTGDSMKEVHAGMRIDEAQMFAVVEQLRSVMLDHGVPLRERNELLALLAPNKRDIVTQ